MPNQTHEVTLSNDDIYRIARALDSYFPIGSDKMQSDEDAKARKLRTWLVEIANGR